MDFRRKDMSKKKIIGVVACLVLIICTYLVLWVINYNKYSKWEKNLSYNEWSDLYTYVDGDIQYTMEKPPLYSFRGSLSIIEYPGLSKLQNKSQGVESDKTQDNVEENDAGYAKARADIIVWPQFTGGYKIAVTITVEDENGEDYKNILLDQDMNLIEKKDSDRKVYEQYKELIENAYDRVKNMWDIFN